jgi:hypothetical protein
MRMLNWWLLCWRGSRTLTLVFSNRKAIDGNCASNYGQEVHACLFSVRCHNSNCCPQSSWFWWLTEFLAREALAFNRASRLALKPLPRPCGFSAYQQYGLESAIYSFL